MKFAISNEGATALCGAAFAAVAGIMLGGAMRPQLIFDGRPMGPQMFADGGGTRSTGPFDLRDAYAAYGGKLPTYVTGTDYAQAAYVDEPPAVEPPQPPAARPEVEAPRPVPLTRAGYEVTRLPLVVYPSEAGGAAYQAETPTPPAPPEDEPPTITG